MQEYSEKKEKEEVFGEFDDPLFDSQFESGNLFAAFKVVHTDSVGKIKLI